jgi:post-segregation antitoxin (ccd killing protein)
MEEEDRYTRITLRIPKDLHARLEAAAGDTSKSLNAEIVSRLTAAMDLPDIAAFQLRKSLLEFDAAAARAETLTTSLHLFETALALKMAVARVLHSNLSPLKPGEAEKWDKAADDAIAEAQAVLDEQGNAMSELKAAGDRIDESRKRQRVRVSLKGD